MQRGTIFFYRQRYCLNYRLPRGSAHKIEFALQIPENRGGVYLGFLTLRGRKFPNGNFRTSVFCQSRTQLVGKTKFCDSYPSIAV